MNYYTALPHPMSNTRHLVPFGQAVRGKALCGAEPHLDLNTWTVLPPDVNLPANCQKCLKKIAAGKR